MIVAGDLRRAGALIAAGAAPFVAARALYDPAAGGGDVEGPEVPCPFRAATGLPCPLCGATRAVALAAHGDPAFVDFGAVWVVVLAAVAVTGLVTLVRPLRAPPALPLSLATIAAAWTWALAHAGTIAPG